MKKVAIVYHYFAHYRKPIIHEIINFDNKNYDFKFFSDDTSNEPSLEVYNFNETKDKYSKVRNFWFGKWLWQKNLLKELRSFSPDVIIFLGQFNFLSTWIYAAYFKLLGKKVIFWGHGVYGNEQGIKKIIRNVFNSLPHTYMTYGDYAKELMLKSSVRAKRITPIYNSLDFDNQKNFYDKLHSTYSPLSNSFNIVFIGRLTKIKKIELLIDASIELLKMGYDLNIKIIGDGPMKENLINKVNNSNYSCNFNFIGPLYDELIISSYLFKSHVCISPGNVGLTGMHSLAYGTPVITHDNFSKQMPEFEAITDGFNGSFFKEDSCEDLVLKIKFWMGEYHVKDFFDIKKRSRKIILDRYNPKNQASLIIKAIDCD
ncbi:putative glycosyltransferase [Photobacterium angustum S14]|uniref:Putative glycosyltransferase n=1 Tax=Photobacterium angustum (strain S14 / CCUG 15956) TaxID=314292 RepID=Q1ZRU4_PHOAS|nr:glycosyltransferase family 4 protein [Photobacterium angustum]EAS65233.1 putative glycosyltransferase [Photobacterium angustum S14]